nr:DinB family protein [Methylobacterium brachythecii]
MAAYNAVLNTKTYTAAARLSDGERRADRGAFWHSIQGTLNHLLWADRMWMSRIDGWKAPNEGLAESGGLHEDFATLAAERTRIDTDLAAWAARLDPTWLGSAMTWFSGAAGREMTAPRALIVMHLFNHQTHHRGQVHAMLTAAGQRVGDTDLPLVLSSAG